jgi:hypothetical protein
MRKHSLIASDFLQWICHQIHWPFPPFPVEHWVRLWLKAKQKD